MHPVSWRDKGHDQVRGFFVRGLPAAKRSCDADQQRAVEQSEDLMTRPGDKVLPRLG